ncbi:MAG: sensor histidine kinase [Velocimicrobium sp.]
MKHFLIKKTMKNKLIRAFIVTSIIPILVMYVFSYYNSSKLIRKNVDELTMLNLLKTRNSLDIWLESYSDILYQIYTDDNIVALVDKINQGEDMALSRYQLRKALRGFFYTKEYIKSITIITENGTVVFYDLLTATNIENSWLGNYTRSEKNLFDEISVDNKTHILPTRRATNFASDTYYLFHLGHRIIDYKHVTKKNGVVIVSVDENMLKRICTSSENENEDINNFNFIVDAEGEVVSYIDSQQLSRNIYNANLTEVEKKEAYRKFLEDENVFNGGIFSIYVTHDDTFNWDIINVSDQSNIIEQIKNQRNLLIITLLISFFIIISIIFILTERLTSSIKMVVETMKEAGRGHLSERTEIVKRMPMEIEIIAVQFNNMLDKVENLVENEIEAKEQLKNAEIKALEAQINPHFLYNTLDTINWMAIDNEEYEISTAINSLASILRYGIDNSNAVVSIRDEVDWLKQYIYLQQTRLKNTFISDIQVEPSILDRKIHKLLLQPFVENAIGHGFYGIKRVYKLLINIREVGDYIEIRIKDNGKGIDDKIVQDMNQGVFNRSDDKNHIGMENAITRIKMYYGENSDIKVVSTLGKGTEIFMKIPKRW